MITFTWLGVDFQYEVWKVLDLHVKVTPGSVLQFFTIRFNYKVKRK